MTDNDPDKPQPPAPPTSIPPLPPAPELLRPSVPHVPLTPMMDFFQRRLEALEKELTLEREKARSAQGLLAQQDSMRGEVENQLKTLSENIRREKAERDSEEVKSHARGRIDVLEKRLDETHQSFVALLKEAITQRENGAQAASASQAALVSAVNASQSELSKEQAALSSGQASLRQEITALSGAINALMEQVAQWRTESQGLGHLVPEVRALASQVPADGRRLETQLAQQLSQFSSEVREKMADWERRQELEAQKQHDRLEALSREKTALLRAWDEQNHELRQQSVKEKISRESEVAGLVGDVARRMDELKLEQQRQARESAEINQKLAKTLEMLTTPPKAKDQMIEALEREKSDFAKALLERSEALRRFTLERVEIERSMGESLLRLQGELEQGRKRELLLASRVADFELQLAAQKERMALGEKAVAERDDRLAVMLDERDRLVKSIVGEAEKNRLSLEERAASDEAWAQRLSDLQKKLGEEMSLRARDSEVVSELRSQIQTLTDHMTRALQEKDAVAQRFSGWEAERQKLLGALKEKDEMISMLNATFQNMLKK
jgi:chromosome segregation ATPase